MKKLLLAACFVFFGLTEWASAQYLEAAKGAWDAYKGYKADQDGIRASQKILNAVARAEANILGELTKLQEREVEVCTKAMLIDFPDFYKASRQTQENFARDYLTCIARGSVLVRDKDFSTAEVVGKFFNVVVPIALTAREFIRFETRQIIDLAIATNRDIIKKLEPECKSKSYPDIHREHYWKVWTCVAPDGRSVDGWKLGKSDYVNQLMKGTAYEIAEASLKQLAGL